MRATTVIVLVLLLGSAGLGAAQQDSSETLPTLTAIPPGEQPAGPGSPLTPVRAAVLGLVEGLTEYLPISSTGHLAVAERLLGIGRTAADKRAADAYAIVIQGGAILAVLVISLGRIGQMLRGLAGRDRDGLHLAANLAVAFAPAAVIGFLFEESIRSRLFGTWPVVAAWIVGGAAILALTRWQAIGAGTGGSAASAANRGRPLESLGWRHALGIGLAQSIALWPGVSRSLVTIVAAVLLGLSVPAAVEFSFLLGLVTLGAAAGYEAVKSGSEIVAAFGWITPAIGFTVALVTAFLAVRWMLGYLRRRSLSIFGWYRIGIGVLVAALALTKVL